MKNIFKDYERLRRTIDKRSGELETVHENHMNCKAGCDLCCIDYSIFPIEFYYIVEQLKNESIPPTINSEAKTEDCIFLTNHKCNIYDQRPIICRTHGLPLLFMSEDGNWELSACHLNFTTFDMSEFSEENTYAQDKYNSKLFLINKQFIEEFMCKKYNEFDLIPIRELKAHL